MIRYKIFDCIWSYSAKILNIGIGILVLPVIISKLSSEELGIWYIFFTISGMINLLDFGFLPTLQRNIGYIFQGARELKSEGIPNNLENYINYQLLYDTIYASKKLYHRVSIMIFIVLSTFGTYYIYSMVNKIDNYPKILIAWLLYLFSLCLNFYFYYYSALIRGKGLIGKAEKIVVFSKIIFIFTCYIFFYLNFGLLTLSIANLLSVLFLRFFSRKLFYDIELKKIFEGIEVKNRSLLKIILKNTKKTGVSSIGGFLLLNGNIFIVSKYFSLDIVGKYGLTIQIFSILLGTAATIYNVYIPEFYKYRIKNLKEDLKRIYSYCYTINFLILLVGIFVINTILPIFLKILGKATGVLNQEQLLFLSIYFILESIYETSLIVLSTKNYISYANSSFYSGVGVILISLFLINFTSLGIWSVLLSPFLIQIFYNHWKWILELNKELNVNSKILITEGSKILYYKIRRIINK